MKISPLQIKNEFVIVLLAGFSHVFSNRNLIFFYFKNTLILNSHETDFKSSKKSEN